MNSWMADARVQRGETLVLEAERAERRGDTAVAMSGYLVAGELFADVAAEVSNTHPNTKTDLTIAAVASFTRAANFSRAFDLAEHMLAEFDSLTAHGRSELLTAVQRCEAAAWQRGATEAQRRIDVLLKGKHVSLNALDRSAVRYVLKLASTAANPAATTAAPAGWLGGWANGLDEAQSRIKRLLDDPSATMDARDRSAVRYVLKLAELSECVD